MGEKRKGNDKFFLDEKSGAKGQNVWRRKAEPAVQSQTPSTPPLDDFGPQKLSVEHKVIESIDNLMSSHELSYQSSGFHSTERTGGNYEDVEEKYIFDETCDIDDLVKPGDFRQALIDTGEFVASNWEELSDKEKSLRDSVRGMVSKFEDERKNSRVLFSLNDYILSSKKGEPLVVGIVNKEYEYAYGSVDELGFGEQTVNTEKYLEGFYLATENEEKFFTVNQEKEMALALDNFSKFGEFDPVEAEETVSGIMSRVLGWFE